MRSPCTQTTANRVLAVVAILGFAVTGTMTTLTALMWGAPSGSGAFNPFAPVMMETFSGAAWGAYRMVVLALAIGVYYRLRATVLLTSAAGVAILNVGWWAREWFTEGPEPLMATNWVPAVLTFGLFTVVALGVVSPRVRGWMDRAAHPWVSGVVETEPEPDPEPASGWWQRLKVYTTLVFVTVMGMTAIPMALRGFVGW